MRLRTILLFVSPLIFSLSARAQQKDQFIRTIQTVKQAVVAVVCVQNKPDGTTGLASIEGTGFFVSTDETFITAGHVAHGLYLAAPPRQAICETAAIYVPNTGWQAGVNISLTWFKIDMCKFDDDLDLAKCGTVENPFTSNRIKVKPSTVAFDISTQQEGIEIGFTGFPLSTAQPITARGTIGTYWGLPSEASPREIVIDHSNWPGASGSPVYLSNGKVIGLVLKRGINDAAGFAFARTSKFIEDFLSK
jgi:hypothetical protein